MIRIDRKAHKRKSYTRKGTRIKAAKVKRSVFLARDRGKRGRGTPYLPANRKEKSILGKKFFEKNIQAQERILAQKARTLGERPVQGKLQHIATLQQRTNPTVAKRAKSLRKWVATNFEGKTRV